MREITPETTSYLIRQCYEAGIGTGTWMQFCEAFDQALDGAYVHLLAHDAYVHACVENVAPRYSEEFVATYTQHYAAISPFVASLMTMPLGVALDVRDLFSYEELERTEFYNDWMRPQEDIFAGGGVALFRNASRLIHFGVHVRRKDEEHKLPQLFRLLDLLTPHLRNAFVLSRQPIDLCLGGFVRPGSGGVRDCVIPVSRKGSLVDSTASLEGFEAFASFGKQGQVEFANPDTQLCFEWALQSREPRSFVARSFDGTETAFAILVPAGADRVGKQLGLTSSAKLHSILTLTKPPSKEELREYVLRRGLGLSSAQADVCVGLILGKTLQTMATERAVSIHTIRNQVRAIFERTGAHRQEELISVLALGYETNAIDR